MKRNWIGAGIGLVAMALSGAAAAQTAAPISRPDWIQMPTGEEMGDTYPEEAIRRGVSGGATLTCAVTAEGLLTGCTAVEDMPGGYGFDVAALSLAGSFRMKPTTREGRPVEGGSVVIPIIFRVPDEPSEPPAGLKGMKFGDGTIIVTKIDAGPKPWAGASFICPDGHSQCAGHLVKWNDRPDAAASAAILERSGQTQGLALANCTIAADGLLRDCEIHRAASPAAEAAVKEALARMRAGPVTEDGLATAGAHVQIPFQWDWLISGLK